ncbi:MAG: hypothetical protein ACE5JA_09935, partial [bacterium]
KECLNVVSGAMMVSGSGFDSVKECKGLISKLRINRIGRSMELKLREIREGESKGENVSRLQREYQSLVELKRKEFSGNE